MSNEHKAVKKQDPAINEELLSVKDWFQKHGSTVLTGILVVAIAAVAVWTLQQRREQGKTQAQQLLANAQSTAQFQEIVNRFPKSDAAPLALLSLAKLQFDLAQYNEAINSYKSFQESWAEHPLASTATLGQLFALEALGAPEQIQEAEAGFRAFADANPTHYLYPQARLGEARCKQLMGQLEEARSIYQNFLASHPENPWVNQIEERLSDLDRKIRRQSAKDTAQNA